MSNFKQANLHKVTHDLLEDLLEYEKESNASQQVKKPSKASIIHSLVLSYHKKVFK